ncbi:MAG: single-stranded-DNA-specific exonuclease RecJ [Patescibacteria group bacterium]|nr:single-stranded-DNA-specific exonuclease RecJ [Patescibacteria group bacterium]
MAKKWRLLPQKEGDLQSQLLANRGLSKGEWGDWLEPNYERDVHDPFLMKDMDKAIKLVLESVERGDRIAIFADYDADGVPGAVILSEWLKRVGHTNYEVYIPHRHEEDYGLSIKAIEGLAANGCKILITIDCGITNVAEVARAKELGMKVIVTDHHLLSDTVPSADAILNPKQADDEYPEKMLCGAGVIFKLAQGLLKATTSGADFRGFTLKGSLPEVATSSQAGDAESPPPTKADDAKSALAFGKWLLDLVAIATVGDMVPLRGENRALAYFGLKVLRRTRRPGLISLYRLLRLDPTHLTEDDIGFSIAPRINSASRMTHAEEAYELLSTADPARAMVLAEHLEKKNKERKQWVEKILQDEAVLEIAQQDSPVLVAGSEDWNLGVLGLACARLAEEHYRPVFLWGKNGSGLIKGSCRSDGNINVVELMKGAAEGLFAKQGGHAMAGGFSVTPERLGELSDELNKSYAKLTAGSDEIEEAELPLDYVLRLADINEDTNALVSALAPYGMGFNKPLFLLSQVKLLGRRSFGATNNHLELTVGDGEFSVKAVAFFQANTFTDILNNHSMLDLAVHLEKSYFRGRPELRLRLTDLRPSG